jgi:prophage regulatory protein
MRSDEQASHGELPATGYLRQTDLVGSRKQGTRGIIPFSPATLWRKVKAKEFPQPVKLSAGVTAGRVAIAGRYDPRQQPS